jgi:hypothetical protein
MEKGDGIMTNIRVYEDTAKLIEEIADKYDTTEAEVIDTILGNLTEDDIDEMF